MGGESTDPKIKEHEEMIKKQATIIRADVNFIDSLNSAVQNYNDEDNQISL